MKKKLLFTLFISYVCLTESLNLILTPGHNLNLIEQSKTIYDHVNRLLNDLRDCTNDGLLLLLKRDQNTLEKTNLTRLGRANPQILDFCGPQLLPGNLRCIFALNLNQLNQRTGWRAIFGYDFNNNVIFYGIGMHKIEIKI